MPSIEVNRIAIGQVRKPHGVQGGLKVTLNNIDLDTLRKMEQLFVKSGSNWKQLTLKSLQGYDDYAIMRFNEIADRTEAETFRDELIYTDRDDLPEQPNNDFYVDDLVGCEVEDEAKVPLGTVAEILNTGAHDVLVVLQDDDETLIPLVDEWVAVIDVEKKYIQVRTVENI